MWMSTTRPSELVRALGRRHRFNRRLISSDKNGVQGVRVLESVQDALSQGKPVVALESTIVAHGMPFPENLQLAQEVGTILRNKGVEPATCAVLDGVCRVGLTPEELEDLALSKRDNRVQKCSTREISSIMAKHQMARTRTTGDGSSKPQWGATTVASTMVLAKAAQIETFVTGGIGGVHRGGEVSMDVSADLTELSRTPVVVVSAGIKSILDISRTLEVLETFGVPAIAYQADDFPAFFSPHSGVRAPDRMDDPATVAGAYWAARTLGLSHGMLVAVPNLDPAGEAVEGAIQSALVEADRLGIHGRDVTPFILQRVAEETEGDSLRSNMNLVKRNAEVGADIAIEIAKQRSRSPGGGSLSSSRNEGKSTFANTGESLNSDVVVMGGIVLDIVAKPEQGRKLLMKTSNPAVCQESDGGVGRNVAEVLGRLGSRPILCSATGADLRGQSILNRLSECGVQVGNETIPVIKDATTASYLALLDEEGDLHTACADMTVLSQIQVPSEEILQGAKFLVIDANPSLESIKAAAERAHGMGVSVFFEPTSVPKAAAIGAAGDIMSCFSFASPNLDELFALDVYPSKDLTLFQDAIQDLEIVKASARRVLERMNPSGATLLITLGAHGLLHAKTNGQSGTAEFVHYPVTNNVDVVNATGAGDTLTGAFIHALLCGEQTDTAIKGGMAAAIQSLVCAESAISPDLVSSLR